MAGTPEAARRIGKLYGGRKPGATSVLTRQKAHEISRSGKSPMDVMMNNMLFWFEHAQQLGEQLQLLVVQVDDPDARAAAFNLVKNFLASRENAQKCAVELAPYVHPKLAAIEVTGPEGGPLEVLNVRNRIAQRIARLAADPPAPEAPSVDDAGGVVGSGSGLQETPAE